MSGLFDRKVEDFFIKGFDIDRIFDSIGRADYLFLYYIDVCGEKDGGSSKVYLTRLAEEMKLTIPQVSKAVRQLQEKGYVEWKMNEEKDRTYVELTQTAVELMHDERERMKNYYTLIKEEIPQEELESTINTIKKIGRILERG